MVRYRSFTTVSQMRTEPRHAGGPVVVTGANGIVGRAVMKALAAAGISALAVVRPGSLAAGGTVALDLGSASAELLKRVAEPPRAIVHLAAAVPHAVEYPDTDATAGLTRRIDGAVAAAASQWRVPVIYASTCGLYDPLSPHWKSEEAVTRIRSPYFAAKLDGERHFLAIADATVLRLSAVYGAGMRKSVVLAKFIEIARSGAPIGLWGSGRREQDFIHASDVASCVIAALDRPGCGILNVAGGKATTMRELAETVVSALGGGRIESVGEPDPKENETARYSIARSAQILGWRPQVSLFDGVRSLATEGFRS